MSMATWCATVRESYRSLQRALKRARYESEVATSPGRSDGSLVPSPSTLGRGGQSPVTNPPESPSPTSSSKETVPEPEQMPTPERPSAAAAAAADLEEHGFDEEPEEFIEDPDILTIKVWEAQGYIRIFQFLG